MRSNGPKWRSRIEPAAAGLTVRAGCVFAPLAADPHRVAEDADRDLGRPDAGDRRRQDVGRRVLAHVDRQAEDVARAGRALAADVLLQQVVHGLAQVHHVGPRVLS